MEKWNQSRSITKKFNSVLFPQLNDRAGRRLENFFATYKNDLID